MICPKCGKFYSSSLRACPLCPPKPIDDELNEDLDKLESLAKERDMLHCERRCLELVREIREFLKLHTEDEYFKKAKPQ